MAQYAAEVKPLLSCSYHSLQFTPITIQQLPAPEAAASKEGSINLSLPQREGAGRGGAPLGPTIRFAITVLEGAMVTGWYGSGFNLWPEENRRKLSDLIYKI